MNKINVGTDLYLKGRIGWKGLSKDEYLEKSQFRIINGTALEGKFINWKKCGFISEERYEESQEIKLKENDILISKDGTLGKIGYVKNLKAPSTVASGIFVLRNIISDKLDTDYLYHFLKSNIFTDFINRMKASGSTILHLYQRDLAQLELDVPEIKLQKRIAQVLNFIDSKIELNNRINADLEAMAKTLYDYWFVQFDFPDKNGKPYKTSAGRMAWSDELKREIPEGWEVKRLYEIADLKAGGDKPKNYSDIQTDTHQIPIYSNGINKDGLYGFTDEAKILKPSITVSARGTIGYCAFRNKPFVPIIRLIVVTPKNPYEAKFLYERLKSIEFENSGSVQQQLTVPQISGLKVVMPSSEILINYDALTSSGMKIIEINKGANQKLAELRDWLLPLLMNGQVKVEGEISKTVNAYKSEALPVNQLVT